MSNWVSRLHIVLPTSCLFISKKRLVMVIYESNLLFLFNVVDTCFVIYDLLFG